MYLLLENWNELIIDKKLKEEGFKRTQTTKKFVRYEKTLDTDLIQGIKFIPYKRLLLAKGYIEYCFPTYDTDSTHKEAFKELNKFFEKREFKLRKEK